MIWYRDEFLISDEKDFLNTDYIHDYLSNKSYWAENIPMDIVKKSIAGSFCFGVYKKENQIGFARAITDKATFGYLADVFIDEDFRGKGLGKWLVEIIMSHPELQGFRSWMLGTKDAHSLYTKFGFRLLENSQRIMRRNIIDVYPKKANDE
jgi:GNAT superfamily N-acetyltransferase